MSHPVNPAEQRVLRARAELLVACLDLLDGTPGPDLKLREWCAEEQVRLRPGFERER